MYDSNLRSCAESMKELGFDKKERRYYLNAELGRLERKDRLAYFLASVGTGAVVTKLLRGMALTSKMLNPGEREISLLECGIFGGIGALTLYAALTFKPYTNEHLKKIEKTLKETKRDLALVSKGERPLGNGLEGTFIG